MNKTITNSIAEDAAANFNSVVDEMVSKKLAASINLGALGVSLASSEATNTAGVKPQGQDKGRF